MTLEGAVRLGAERARRLRLDPQVTISEVYEAELLGRLQQLLRGRVVWKGGTVLRLEGSERFSRDLDATGRAVSPQKLRQALEAASRELAHLVELEVNVRQRSVTAAYHFAIPSLRHPVRLLVEISLREKLLLPATTTSTARIAHPYGLDPVVIACLDPAELLAEKARALVTRAAGRDIYDVYWLLERGARLDPALFLRKMAYYRTVGKPVDPVEAVRRAIAQLASYGPSRAKAELANLLPAAQRRLDFQVILEDVRGALQDWLRQME